MRAIKLAFPVDDSPYQGDLNEHLDDLREQMDAWKKVSLQSTHTITLEADEDRNVVVLEGEMTDLADAIMVKTAWSNRPN